MPRHGQWSWPPGILKLIAPLLFLRHPSYLTLPVLVLKVAATARAVVLASGTLSPVEPLLQLFPQVPGDSLHRYSCGHVVGRER